MRSKDIEFAAVKLPRCCTLESTENMRLFERYQTPLIKRVDPNLLKTK